MSRKKLDIRPILMVTSSTSKAVSSLANVIVAYRKESMIEMEVWLLGCLRNPSLDVNLKTSRTGTIPRSPQRPLACTKKEENANKYIMARARRVKNDVSE